MALRAVIFCVRDVIGSPETGNGRDEIVRLLKYLHGIGIQVAFYSKSHWKIGDRPINEAISDLTGFPIPYFCCDRDGLPARQRRDALDPVLASLGVQKNEAILVGNTHDDMIAGVNNKILFVNATWYGANTTYGFQFPSPRELARFIGVFCTRQHYWFFRIEEPGLRVFTLGPFSTILQQYAGYSADARNVAKTGTGHVDFWTNMLVSSLYFSGLYREINFVAPYPGHRQGFAQTVVDEPLITFAKCFQATYLPDLIERHTKATKSQTARNRGQAPVASTQLNTINLNRSPHRYNSARAYQASPLRRGKTVLIVDDICTAGNSLEAARAYVAATGANAILLAWLKTINTPYSAFTALPNVSPYAANTFAAEPPSRQLGYRAHIDDPAAPDEIANRFAAYATWNWPPGI